MRCYFFRADAGDKVPARHKCYCWWLRPWDVSEHSGLMPPMLRAVVGRLKASLPVLPWLLLGLALGCGLLVGLLFVFLRLIPAWIATSSDDLGETRTAVLVFLGGLVAVVGAVFTARTYLLNRQGQLTDRFSNAIEHLGNRESVDVRLGGIYALERLARESDSDRRPIHEILTAFVREHSALGKERQDPAPTAFPGYRPWMGSPPAGWPPVTPAVDVQAALTFITRIPMGEYREDGAGLDLSRLDLRGARLQGAHLEDANLADSNLADANLRGAHLSSARLVRTLLVGANISECDLKGASLQAAQLKRAFGMKADFRSARRNGGGLVACTLFDADLSESHLQEANFTGAHLQNADLRGALLIKADLTEASIDEADLGGASLSAPCSKVPICPKRIWTRSTLGVRASTKRLDGRKDSSQQLMRPRAQPSKARTLAPPFR